VDVMAVLDEYEIPLSTAMNWKVGDTLVLNTTPDSEIKMVCGTIPVAKAKMGRMGHHVAVRVSESLTSANMAKKLVEQNQ